MLEWTKGAAVSDEQLSSQERVDDGIGAYEGSTESVASVDFVWSVAAGLAVAPFLQAVASHFGNRLAEGLDERTRAAVRLFLRRSAEEGGDDQDVSGTDQPRLVSLSTEYGWRLSIPEDLPAEGLLHLFALCKADPPVDRFTAGWVYWEGESWRGKALTSAGIVRWVWDPTTQDWVTLRG
ncbi:hypothetical protein [Streptomyces sp. NPDC018031]|uniref:hypothetical protein n=1 Tax=Streptomyces sp. NPDC018031 TaxID=3365033 RepID=UPI00378BC3C6